MIHVEYVCDVCRASTKIHFYGGLPPTEHMLSPLKHVNCHDVCEACESKIEFEVIEDEEVSA